MYFRTVFTQTPRLYRHQVVNISIAYAKRWKWKYLVDIQVITNFYFSGFYFFSAHSYIHTSQKYKKKINHYVMKKCFRCLVLISSVLNSLNVCSQDDDSLLSCSIAETNKKNPIQVNHLIIHILFREQKGFLCTRNSSPCVVCERVDSLDQLQMSHFFLISPMNVDNSATCSVI